MMLKTKPLLFLTLAIAMVALFAAVPAGAALCNKCSSDPEVDPPGTCADMLIVGSRADSNWTCRMTYDFDETDTTWSITCCPTAKGQALKGASHGSIIWNRKCGGSEAYDARCFSEGANISYYPSGQGDSQGVGYPFLDTDSCKIEVNWGEKEFTVSLSALGEEVPVHDEYVDLKDHQLLFAIKAGQDRAVGYFTGPIGCLPEPCPPPVGAKFRDQCVVLLDGTEPQNTEKETAAVYFETDIYNKVIESSVRFHRDLDCKDTGFTDPDPTADDTVYSTSGPGHPNRSLTVTIASPAYVEFWTGSYWHRVYY